DVDALVKLLCDAHRAPGVEAQTARRLLLERAGRERRQRLPLALASLDGVDDELRMLKLGEDRLDFVLAAQLDGLVANAEQARAERLARRIAALGGAGQLRVDGPVLLGYEVLDLALALDDQPHGDRLHAACREARAHLLPQQRAELVAHQPVEDAPGLLRVDQVHVDLSRLFERLAHRIPRDLVEHHAVRALLLDLGGSHQVPGNRLTLAVEVGSQVNFLRLRRSVTKLVDDLALVVRHAVAGLEVVLDVDGQPGLKQVTDVTHRGPDFVIPAEVVFDGARLCRRLDDDQLATARLPVALILRAPDGLGALQPLVGRRLAHAVQRGAALRADARRRGLAALREGRLRLAYRALGFALHTISCQNVTHRYRSRLSFFNLWTISFTSCTLSRWHTSRASAVSIMITSSRPIVATSLSLMASVPWVSIMTDSRARTTLLSCSAARISYRASKLPMSLQPISAGMTYTASRRCSISA